MLFHDYNIPIIMVYPLVNCPRKRTGKIHHFSWINQLFQKDPFSIANWKKLPEGMKIGFRKQPDLRLLNGKSMT